MLIVKNPDNFRQLYDCMQLFVLYVGYNFSKIKWLTAFWYFSDIDVIIVTDSAGQC